MKIISLVDDYQTSNLNSVHGLSFYIETKLNKILFDLGPDDTFINNAIKLGIDLSKVNKVIISHGHNDHGGGLSSFLKINSIADIYIHKDAFKKHYSASKDISLDSSLINNRFKLIDKDIDIDKELYIYTSFNIDNNVMNDHLLDENHHKDNFIDEVALLIKENKNVLFSGCSHSGIINIISKINVSIDIVIGGLHLSKSHNDVLGDIDYINNLIKYISSSKIYFYTCHCTGYTNYLYIKERTSNISYISVGTILNI